MPIVEKKLMKLQDKIFILKVMITNAIIKRITRECKWKGQVSFSI